MEPATRIISELGGTSKVAAIVGVHRTRVWNWMQPRDAGGTGGSIPQRHIPALLAHAKANSIALTIDDFFPAAAPTEGAAA